MKRILLLTSALFSTSIPLVTTISCACSAPDDNGVAPEPIDPPLKESVFSIAVARPQTIGELKRSQPYYASLQDTATGESLFQQLHAIQMNHVSRIGTYNDLWEKYKTAFIDNYDEKDGTILDIYEENPLGPDTYVFTPGRDQDKGKAAREGEFYNREHLVPQSVFAIRGRNGYPNLASRNDAHFVFPADKIANTRHGNIPYGETPTGSQMSANGTKKGPDASGENVVEPLNAFKGDVARATFHFGITWRVDPRFNPASKIFPVFTDNKMYPVFSNAYLSLYRAWSKLDPVSQWDVDRNEAIAKAQGGLRNPFTDMPKLVDLIWM